MAQATFSVRMDENLKRKFDMLCNEFGMSASAAINVFARAVVRKKKISFEITSAEDGTREKALQVKWWEQSDLHQIVAASCSRKKSV